jgi:hypothetical protein
VVCTKSLVVLVTGFLIITFLPPPLIIEGVFLMIEVFLFIIIVPALILASDMILRQAYLFIFIFSLFTSAFGAHFCIAFEDIIIGLSQHDAKR